MNAMNLNQIHYLLAIHQCGSITQAAENLFVSAPSVSIAIKNLEEELDCPLLLRHHNGVTFTDEGEEAVRLMQEIDQNLRKLHHLRQETDTLIGGELTVGVSLHTKAALLLPVMLQLKKQYPALSVISDDEKSWEILHAVAQGKRDLGIIHYTNLDSDDFIQTIRRNDLTFQPLFAGEMRFVVRENHPLTKLDRISMKDVLQYPFIYYYQTDFTKAHQKAFQSYAPEASIRQITDRDLFRDMQHNSDAVTAMPSINEISNVRQFSGLVFLHISDFDYRYTIGWLHSADPLSRIEKIVTRALEQEACALRE